LSDHDSVHITVQVKTEATAYLSFDRQVIEQTCINRSVCTALGKWED